MEKAQNTPESHIQDYLSVVAVYYYSKQMQPDYNFISKICDFTFEDWETIKNICSVDPEEQGKISQ